MKTTEKPKRRTRGDLEILLAAAHRERLLLAKLAATGPSFFNPRSVVTATQIRDRVLAEVGLNPDGTPIR